MSAVEHRTPVHEGGCQCGAVRFAYFCEPIKVGACHCRMCQRATSSPFAVLAEIHQSDFAWTSGKPQVFQSSSHAQRGFCANCGSPLSYQVTGSDIIELLACAFDNPEIVAPTYSVGVESQLDWTTKLHQLPTKTTLENSGAEFDSPLISPQIKP